MSWLQIVPSTRMGIAEVAFSRSAPGDQISLGVIARLLAAADLAQIDETNGGGK